MFGHRESSYLLFTITLGHAGKYHRAETITTIKRPIKWSGEKTSPSAGVTEETHIFMYVWCGFVILFRTVQDVLKTGGVQLAD